MRRQPARAAASTKAAHVGLPAGPRSVSCPPSVGGAALVASAAPGLVVLESRAWPRPDSAWTKIMTARTASWTTTAVTATNALAANQ